MKKETKPAKQSTQEQIIEKFLTDLDRYQEALNEQVAKAKQAKERSQK